MDKFESLKLQIEKILDSDKTVLIFIRHGETEANFTKQLSGWHDVKLTEQGLNEGKQLSKAFQPLRDRFAGIFCSDLSRARLTAELALGSSDKIQQSMELRELNFGDHQNKVYSADNKSIYEILFTQQYQAPNGENWNDVQNRIMKYLRSQIHKKGVYLIFTHGGAIFSMTHQFGYTNTIKNCSCIGLELDINTLEIMNQLFYWEFPTQ
ncbi:unnamed protein product [Paramecium primaurelia]|uniref:Phosphoglycerate mutase n=1 Tax=Paramecium primaurelia TaxID=5886 RepID=A0A8S1QK78_PARPR|nr:unnamed protein product [Paramecium primaurelia]